MTTAVPLCAVKAEVLASELQSRGWRCEIDVGQKWETPSAMSRRLGLTDGAISRILSRGQRIPGLEITRAKGGRIVLVRGNAESEQWLRARKQK